MFGIPGLRFTCPLVWTYALVIPVIISFVLSTFSIYIHLKGKMFFLASIFWTYVLVIPFDYFICCLIFVYYVSMAVCSCHLLFGTVLLCSWKGLFERVQLPGNKLLCSCRYGILKNLNKFMDNELKGLLLTMQDHWEP